MLSVILKKDAFEIDTNQDGITIKKIIPEEGQKNYSAVETKTPHFNQLKSNLERSTSKPKDSEDRKKATSPSPTPTPNSASSGGSKPSGGQRKSWVLNSSDPQTKPFEEQKSEADDSDEKPRFGGSKPEEDKIYSVKDNPFVRGNTPTKNVKSTITESKVITKRTEER